MKIDPSGAPAPQLHRPEQPRAVALLGRGAQRASACTPARAATATRPTAPTSTTPSCSRACSSSRRATSTSRSRASGTASRVLRIIRQYLKPDQRVFVGVVAPIDPRVETPEEVRDRVLEAADYIPVEQLGTTDDCGFSPFSDDTSTTRDTAFAKIRARVAGTRARRGSPRRPGSARPTTKRSSSAPSRCRTRRASCSRASAPSRSCSAPRRRWSARPQDAARARCRRRGTGSWSRTSAAP